MHVDKFSMQITEGFANLTLPFVKGMQSKNPAVKSAGFFISRITSIHRRKSPAALEAAGHFPVRGFVQTDSLHRRN
jgi:hypothetical protein